jgi:multisubunit Na+/H+ antiporter MnhF subunit
VNGWLWAAAVLLATVLPLLLVAAFRELLDGIVAMQAAGVDVALALLALSQGTNREAFADVALVAGVTSFVGSLAFVRFAERVRR